VPCRVVAAIPVGLGAEPDPAMAIRLGDCGPGVQQIQELLVYKGYAITADGQFGPRTDDAVRRFQADFMAVTADGIVGPITWSALNSDDYDPADA
jgi:peptidoglycan hydrolase-like protein with peptidoglycan-binding domain